MAWQQVLENCNKQAYHTIAGVFCVINLWPSGWVRVGGSLLRVRDEHLYNQSALV